MPRLIRDWYHVPVTKALRHTRCKGTICCEFPGCGRPAAQQYIDGKYYCKYHLRVVRGW